jgi:hypothetical protein
MSRFLALMLSALLGSASAHTNAVAFVRVVNTPSGASGSNTIDLTFIYGTCTCKRLLLGFSLSLSHFVATLHPRKTAARSDSLLCVCVADHTFSPPEGALALYGYDGVGTETSASSYNTLLYGQGGSQSDATYPLGVLSNLGVIDWSLTSRLADQPWTRATLEEVGFAVGTNYLHDETSNVAIHSHQQATITIPCAATGTTMRYRPDFDSNPVGQVPRSDLSFNYAPCTVATTYPNCGNFDMTDLLIEVDSSCGVSVVGVQGIGPKSPPPPPSPPCGLNGTLCESSATAPAPQTVTVTIKGEEGEDLVQTVAVYTGNTAVPQPPKTRSACCRRDQIGGDLCPWELECSCCAPDNPWTLEKHPTPFWDPLSGQFQADSSQRCEGDNRLGTCPCCLHPDHPDAGLEHRCPKEWRCHPPPPAAMAPAVPVGIALGVAALTAYIFFKPMTMRLQGTVLDDCGNPVVGATVCFEDGQAKFKKFKGVLQLASNPRQ